MQGRKQDNGIHASNCNAVVDSFDRYGQIQFFFSATKLFNIQVRGFRNACTFGTVMYECGCPCNWPMGRGSIFVPLSGGQPGVVCLKKCPESIFPTLHGCWNNLCCDYIARCKEPRTHFLGGASLQTSQIAKFLHHTSLYLRSSTHFRQNTHTYTQTHTHTHTHTHVCSCAHKRKRNIRISSAAALHPFV